MVRGSQTNMKATRTLVLRNISYNLTIFSLKLEEQRKTWTYKSKTSMTLENHRKFGRGGITWDIFRIARFWLER